MRSATSYFNATLYRKTLARFWPLWVGYGIIWLLCMPVSMLNLYFNRYMNSAPATRLLNQALDLPAYATVGLYLAAFFSILCAMAVFGYLYNSRSACWFHALPMRREALFTTQYLAGLSFLLLPQLLTAVLTAMIEIAFLPMGQWGIALSTLLVWLLAQSGIGLFFFSFAAFCAMFTGHILALPVFYGILNILASVIYFLIDALMREFFFGYAGSSGIQTVVEYLTPCIALKYSVVVYGRSDFGGYYYHSPGTVAAYAAVGVLLAFISLYVYRRRHAETAGDVVAIPLVRPLFKYGVSFCAGLCLGMFTTIFFDWFGTPSLIICVLVWSAVGYFVAEMLLRKSFRVLKAWKGAVAMTMVMFVLCLACTIDLFGVEARMPKLDQVESLTVSFDMGSPYDGGDRLYTVITNPKQIEEFLALHQAIVDNRERLDSNSQHFFAGDGYTYLRLQYDLKGGSSLSRVYGSIPLDDKELDVEGSVTYLTQQLIQDRDLVAQAYDFDAYLNGYRLTDAWLYPVNNSRGELIYETIYVDDYAQELWEAVRQDFAEGNIGVRYLFSDALEREVNTYRTDLTFGFTPIPSPNENDGLEYNVAASARMEQLSITLTPQAKHTLAVLDKTGVWEEGYSLAPQDSGKDGGVYSYEYY